MDLPKTIRLAPGRYVVAVSGGVDSMALLNMLSKHPGLKLTVAHFDHGIRPDSKQDRWLVQDVARQHKLPFVYDEGRLGQGASEDTARQARYDFLRNIRQRTGAHAIITAHHQDDAVETAIHNLLRGTGRKGMSSLHAPSDIVRPLLHVPKHQLQTYARDQGLVWREDSTNADIRFRRNYIRRVLIPRLRAADPGAYRRLAHHVRRLHDVNSAIDMHLETMLHIQPATGQLKRHDVIMLPHNVACELVAHWLRQNGKRQFDRKLVERVVNGIKIASPGKKIELDARRSVLFTKDAAILQST